MNEVGLKKWEVVHVEKDEEFLVDLANAGKAIIQYRREKSTEGKTTLDLHHTFVPESHRNQGIARQLALCAFEYCLTNHYAIKPTCWYLKKVLDSKADDVVKYETIVVDT